MPGGAELPNADLSQVARRPAVEPMREFLPEWEAGAGTARF